MIEIGVNNRQFLFLFLFLFLFMFFFFIFVVVLFFSSDSRKAMRCYGSGRGNATTTHIWVNHAVIRSFVRPSSRVPLVQREISRDARSHVPLLSSMRRTVARKRRRQLLQRRNADDHRSYRKRMTRSQVVTVRSKFRQLVSTRHDLSCRVVACCVRVPTCPTAVLSPFLC